jgi:hypothetical protein
MRSILAARLDSMLPILSLSNAGVQAGDVVIGRHVLNDMRKRISEFVEGGLLCCHTREVHHSRSAGYWLREAARMLGDGFAKLRQVAGAAKKWQASDLKSGGGTGWRGRLQKYNNAGFGGEAGGVADTVFRCA